MRRAAILLLILPLAGGAPALADAARSAAVPAEWQTFDVLVDFENLPRTYSCGELWYRFRDVLLQLGARAYMTITPYDCGYLGGGAARSPHVEVKFQLPAGVARNRDALCADVRGRCQRASGTGLTALVRGA